MTIEEAIRHCEEVAENNETQADKIGRQFIGSAMDKRATECRECAADHRQLAEWLTELKELRNSLGAVKLKDMKEAVGLLQELNTENVQLTSQLAAAKRLVAQLKAKLCGSSEYCAYCDELDMSERGNYTCKYKKKKIPAVCYWQVLTPAHFDDIPWTKNETEKLTGDETDEKP